jgi:glyoxylase-like metal-dependent hydrolase (beta-lactamase superfamily II)
MPRETRLDDLVARVLAPNPSSMTLDGTNTYVLGHSGNGAAALVDPGPPDADHFKRVEAALRELDVPCRWILVTHHHLDHAEAAIPWASRLGAQVAAASPSVAGLGGRVLVDGDRISVGTTTVEVVATPGHCADHLAFRLETGAMLVGDHILGRGTSVVTHPEGDLLAYLESLRRVLDLGPSALYPGHGPALLEDPTAVVSYYLEHRRYRERQILTLLQRGPMDIPGLVRVIYADVDERLWPYAEQSTRAAIDKLQVEDVVDLDPNGLARLRAPLDPSSSDE